MSASESKTKLVRSRPKSLWLLAGAVVALALVLLAARARPLDRVETQSGAYQPNTQALAPTAAVASGSAATHPQTAPNSQGTASQSADAGGAASAAQATRPQTQIKLEKVDDYPLYTMTYDGDYREPGDQAAAISQVAGASKPWACSLFVAFGPNGHTVYGRNFDWDFSPAVLLFTHPRDGFASVSMVDISYLGFDADEVASLSPTDKRLLDAPRIPFDGMNEYGLTVGMAAVGNSKERPADPHRATVGSLGIIRLMLDHAKTVDDAVALLRDHNIDFTGGPPLHYLIADPSGRSAAVEFINGTMQVTRNDAPWQIATNFFVTGASDAAKAQDPRYGTADTRLRQAQGQLSSADAMDLLKQIRQDITQWSIVYDITSGDISVAMGRNYQNIHTFHLARTPPPAQ